MEKICRRHTACKSTIALDHCHIMSWFRIGVRVCVYVCMLGVRGEHVCVMGDSVGPLSAMRSRLLSQSCSVRNNIWLLHPLLSDIGREHVRPNERKLPAEQRVLIIQICAQSPDILPNRLQPKMYTKNENQYKCIICVFSGATKHIALIPKY